MVAVDRDNGHIISGALPPHFESDTSSAHVAVIHLLQVSSGQPRVDLGHQGRAVPHQPLQRQRGHPRPGHADAEGMPPGVRPPGAFHAGLRRQPPQDRPQPAVAQREHPLPIALLPPPPQRLRRLLSEEDHAGLPSFPQDLAGAVLQVDLAPAQREQLGGSHRRVSQKQQRPIPQ